MHLSVIIATLSRLDTVTLLAARIHALLPDLDVEIIAVAPAAAIPSGSSELVRYIADRGRGVYPAFNEGLRHASGEYVWFLGDDDYPLDGVSGLSGIIRGGAADLLIAPVLFSSGRIYRPSRTLLILHFLNWCQQGVIYRRRVFEHYRFYRRLTIQADQYVHILLRVDPSVRRMFLKKPICVFGVNGISGRKQDEGYRSLRLALARRTLNCGSFLVFRALVILQPTIKRLLDIRS